MSPDRSSGIGRREFLVGLGASGLAAGLGTALGCGGAGSLRASLDGFYTDRQAARIVGRIYLNTAPPGESDPDELVARIAGDNLASWESLAADRDSLFDAVRARHRDDFEQGRTASVDGWVLSRTEARLCALAALG